MILEDGSFLGHQVYRAALLCHSSDIPATRKCGGFVGHGAYRGNLNIQTFFAIIKKH